MQTTLGSTTDNGSYRHTAPGPLGRQAISREAPDAVLGRRALTADEPVLAGADAGRGTLGQPWRGLP